MKVKTIICNNCLGSRIYEILGQEFNNPFIWNLIHYKDFFNLIRYYDTLDFSNVYCKLNREWPCLYNTQVKYFDKDYSILNIDNKIDIRYIHYVRDDNSKIDRNDWIQHYSRQILEYTLDTWYRRLERLKKNDDVVFLYFPLHEKIGEEEFLSIKTPHKKILLSTDADEKYCWRRDENTHVIQNNYGGMGALEIAEPFVRDYKTMLISE